MTEQLGVRCLLEDDNSRPERREGHVQTTAAGEGPELWGEVLQIGPRGTAQEQEHVVVEALCPCTIDYYIRHRQYLEKKGEDTYRAKTEGASVTFTKKTGHTEKWNIDVSVQSLADKLQYKERLTRKTCHILVILNTQYLKRLQPVTWSTPWYSGDNQKNTLQYTTNIRFSAAGKSQNSHHISLFYQPTKFTGTHTCYVSIQLS